MKLQLNGFDIEFNSDEANITVKVMDANGKELSNNTYSQSMEQSDDVTEVEMPEPDEFESTQDEEETSETEEESTEEESTEEESTEEETEETEEPEMSDVTEDEEEVGESFMDFETFKKNMIK